MTSSETSVADQYGHRRSSAYVGVAALLGAVVLLVLTTPGPHSGGPAEKAELAAAAARGPGSEAFEPIQCEPRGATVRRSQTTKRKVVALTFDDGPSDLTNRYIRTLDRFGAHGTFFVVGRYIPGREQVLRRAVKGNHAVGNHTFEHADVTPGGAAAVAQIEPTSKLIEDATGVQPCIFRPPYGGRSSALDKLLERERMMDILWNVDPADYSGVPADITAERTIDGIERGNIVLLHDGGGDEATTLAALPRILRAIKKRGFEAVTIPDLLKLELKPGEMPERPDPNPLPKPEPEPKKPKSKSEKPGQRSEGDKGIEAHKGKEDRRKAKPEQGKKGERNPRQKPKQKSKPNPRSGKKDN